MPSKRQIFLAFIKCQLKRKKIDTACSWRFFKFQLTREWVNKVNLSSFQLQNVFKFVLAWLVREKQNILTSQPWLYTVMQTRLSANQTARTFIKYYRRLPTYPSPKTTSALASTGNYGKIMPLVIWRHIISC